MTSLRSLTDAGRRAAAEVLARIRSGEQEKPVMGEFETDALSRSLPVEFDDPADAEATSRWQLACWMDLSFGRHVEHLDAGTWSWLSLHLFDVLCPQREGKRTVREDARYLLEAGDYRKAHRHLLAGPFLLLRAHIGEPEAVMGLLATKPDAPGEVYEQLAARKYTVTSRAVVQVATRLYFDPSTGRLRRGAGGSSGGSPRRLSEVLQQFDLTYDLQNIPADRLLSLLPKEFARFLKT